MFGSLSTRASASASWPGARDEPTRGRRDALVGATGAYEDRSLSSLLSEKSSTSRMVIRAQERLHDIATRPSDAVAIAIRADAPIWVNEDVMARGGVFPDEDDDQLSAQSASPDD